MKQPYSTDLNASTPEICHKAVKALYNIYHMQHLPDNVERQEYILVKD